MASQPRKPRVFIDADVIFAGAASPSEHSASNVVLRMGEITLLETLTSQQAIVEVERNLAEKLPAKLPQFRQLVRCCLQVVPDPELDDLSPYHGQADPKDLPLLVAALREKCSFLLTFNTRHYFPTTNTITIKRPGDFLLIIRESLDTSLFMT
jgi:predicted nucleic acid-binding protein